MNKCACGEKFPGVQKLNGHRRNCDAFYESVYTEMRRIAYLLYNKPVSVSMVEWNLNRRPDFPCYHWLVKCRSWTELQRAAGMGVSSHGRGAAATKGLPLYTNTIHSNLRMDAKAMAIEIISVSPEVYMALPGEGLPICERLYLETGRMWVR